MLPRRLIQRGTVAASLACSSSAAASVAASPPSPSGCIASPTTVVSAGVAPVVQRRGAATATAASAAAGLSSSVMDMSNVHSDFSALIGVGWTRSPDDEKTVVASAVTLFCHRTDRTLVVEIADELRGAKAVTTGPAITALREKIRAFVDPSIKHVVTDISGAARQQVHATAVFLPHQQDATAARLRVLFVMPPCDRVGLAGPGAETGVRAYYMVPPKDAWGLMYAFALDQRRVIRGLPVPKSLVDVHNMFAPSPFQVLAGESEAARWARLGVHACLAATLRFAGPHAFSESPLISKEGQVAAAVVSRCILPVRTFVIAVTRKAKSITDRFQFEVKAYDPAKRSSKAHGITGFNDEKNMAEFAKVLGRPNSLTVLLPAPGCDEKLIVSFVRSLKVTNPVYIFNENALRSTLQLKPTTKSANPQAALSEVWTDLSGRAVGGAECVLSVCTIIARDRHRGASNSGNATAGVPPQAVMSEATIAQAQAAANAHNIPMAAAPASSGATTGAATSTPIGQVSAPATAKHVTSSAASFGDVKMSVDKQLQTQEKLNAWNAMIYSNPRRDEQEQTELKTIEKWLVIDLETTTQSRYKRKANPFLPENRVVLPGFLDYKGNMTIPKKYLGDRKSFKLPNLDDYDVIVGHNVKFDLHYMWRDEQLTKFFERGGKIWDTMYGEYMLSGHALKLGKGAGLEDVARSYGGSTPKLDLVKQAWAKGVQTFDIDIKLLTEYLEGDLRNTALIFEKQRQRAYANRQVVICNARMDSLLCTTEMEYNGLAIDRDLARKQQHELEERLTALKSSMQEMIPPDVPSYYRRQFNWSSLPTLTALLWGGDVTFNPPESRPSLRVPSGTVYAGVDDVSCPAQLAWLAGCLGPKVVKKYTEQFMREMGYRTNNVYSEVFDSATIEHKYDLFHVALRTSFDGEFASEYSGVEGAKLPPLDSPKMHDVKLYELSIVCPIRNIAFRGIITSDSEPAATQAEDGITVTTVRGSTDEVLSGLKAFFVQHSGTGGKVTRRPVLLGRHLAEYGTDILKRNGVDGELLRDVLDADAAGAVQKKPAAATDADADEAEGEDGEAAAVPSTVQEPTLFTADSMAIEEHAAYFFPQLCAEARAQHLGVPHGDVTGVKKAASASKKTKKGAAAAASSAAVSAIAAPKKADATIQTARCERLFMSKCTGDTLRIATKVGRFTQAVAEGVTAQYCETKAATDVSTLTEKRRAKPKRDYGVISPLDTLFELKGIQASSLLDRGFESVSTDPAKVTDAKATSVELRRLVGLRHVGALLSTHDVFVNRLDEAPIDRLPQKGRLAEYFDDAQERDRLRAKHTSADTGQLQVGEPVLKLMAKAGDKVCKTILEMRGLEKMLSTYYDEKRSGMMALVHEHDSCIHHELQHNKTSTGRLASQNPNCQNIPKEDKSEIRDLFISRFTDPAKGEQGLCVESDYSQLEVVTLCALSHDVNMTKDLKNKVDFHCKRVTLMRPEFSYEEVVQKAKKEKIPEFVKMRQQAKIFSFQRQYGAGVKMLSESTGLDPDTVRALIDNEAKTYYGVDQFYDMVTLSCNTFDASLQDGARSKTGSPIFKGAFAVLSGSQYVFTESDMPAAILENMKRRGENTSKTTTFSPTHLKNYPVQGFAGEIVQIMLGRLWRFFVANKNYDGKALLTNTVHDCVWVDTRKEVAKQVAEDVDRVLSSARSVLNELFPEMDVDVDFPTDTVAGETMGNLRSVKELGL